MGASGCLTATVAVSHIKSVKAIIKDFGSNINPTLRSWIESTGTCEEILPKKRINYSANTISPTQCNNGKINKTTKSAKFQELS